MTRSSQVCDAAEIRFLSHGSFDAFMSAHCRLHSYLYFCADHPPSLSPILPSISRDADYMKEEEPRSLFKEDLAIRRIWLTTIWRERDMSHSLIQLVIITGWRTWWGWSFRLIPMVDLPGEDPCRCGRRRGWGRQRAWKSDDEDEESDGSRVQVFLEYHPKSSFLAFHSFCCTFFQRNQKEQRRRNGGTNSRIQLLHSREKRDQRTCKREKRRKSWSHAMIIIVTRMELMIIEGHLKIHFCHSFIQSCPRSFHAFLLHLLGLSYPSCRWLSSSSGGAVGIEKGEIDLMTTRGGMRRERVESRWRARVTRNVALCSHSREYLKCLAFAVEGEEGEILGHDDKRREERHPEISRGH